MQRNSETLDPIVGQSQLIFIHVWYHVLGIILYKPGRKLKQTVVMWPYSLALRG